MDKTSVCGTDAPGSTPGESTKENTLIGGVFFCARAELSGRQFARSRMAEPGSLRASEPGSAAPANL